MNGGTRRVPFSKIGFEKCNFPCIRYHQFYYREEPVLPNFRICKLHYVYNLNLSPKIEMLKK